jgi:hypothetical protein
MPPIPELRAKTTPGAHVQPLGSSAWRLEIPAGPAGRYAVAQLDDYHALRRARFPWRPPLRLSLSARAAQPTLPGTWGFGLWNDPFTATLGLGGMARALPSVPSAAWYFYASPPNYLALHDNHPAQGFLTATFAARASGALALLGVPLLPLLFWPRTAGLLRRLGRNALNEYAAGLSLDATAWHDYALEWLAERVRFIVDGEVRGDTGVVPAAPLGLVLWIDNQYASFAPGAALRFGSLAVPQDAWLELARVRVEPL